MPDPAPPPVTPRLEAAAEPERDDVRRARLAWQRDAPAFFKYLVDAVLWEDEP